MTPKDISVFLKNSPTIQPEDFHYFHALENRTIFLTQEIDSDAAYVLKLELDYLSRRVKEQPIILNINSPGGSLDEALFLVDLIESMKTPVYAVNMGGAHSAAALVFLAGHKHYWYPHAFMVLHEGSGAAAGTFRETKQAQKDWERKVNIIIDYVCGKMAISREELTDAFDKSSDYYVYSEDLAILLPTAIIGVPQL